MILSYPTTMGQVLEEIIYARYYYTEFTQAIKDQCDFVSGSKNIEFGTEGCFVCFIRKRSPDVKRYAFFTEGAILTDGGTALVKFD